MATMNVSMPDQMRDWVQSRIENGDYASFSDYVRDLIRRDRHEAEKYDYLRKALAEGEASGISERTGEEIIAEARSKARKRRNG